MVGRAMTPTLKLTPPLRERFGPQLENMLRGLFNPNQQPFFQRDSVSVNSIEEFVRSTEAVEAALQFADALMAHWKRQNGGTFLKLAQLEASSIAKPNPVVVDEIPLGLVIDPAGPFDADPTHTSLPSGSNSEKPTTCTPMSDQKEPDGPVSPRTLASHDAVIRPGQTPPAGSMAARAAVPKATFRVGNARVGQGYVAKIEGTDSSGSAVLIRDVRIPAEIGLRFDAATGELHGVPVEHGEHRINLQWAADGVAWYSGDCLLIVNPDPRSLWRQIEPPAEDPYPKDHIGKAVIEGPDFRIVAASRRGRSHEHNGTFRDDDFFVSHDCSSGWSVLIVADGAGSAKSSRQGSRIAVKAAGEHLVTSLAGDVGVKVGQALEGWGTDPVAAGKTAGGEFHYLFHKACSLAVQAIEDEAEAKNASVKDYSTTLLAAAIKRSGEDTFLATFWMGDGAIAAYGPRGTVKLMGTPDGGEFAGQTRFLDRAAMSDHGFGKRVSVGRFPNLSSVLLMTDGISDPHFETDNALADAENWDALWDEISPSLASSEPDTALNEWLGFFTPGHHDDRTIAVLW